LTTIYDIARGAGVSIATVSRVLNNSPGVKEETRQRVLAVIKELNYSPNVMAEALTSKKTYTLGLLIPDIANPFFAELARGVEDRANFHGFNVIICNTDNKQHKESDYLRLLKQKRIDGLIYAAAETGSPGIKELTRKGFPVVLLAREIEGLDLDAVLVDNVEAAYVATKHLVELGHRKIALVTETLNIKSSRDRQRGYLQVLTEEGIIAVPEYQVFNVGSMMAGKKAAKQLLSLTNPPTAAVAFNDMVAIGIIEGVKEMGLKVPRDLSVVGFDDTIIASVTDPPLTTMAQPIHQMGSYAIDRLVGLINGEGNDAKRLVLEARLVVRRSTAFVRGSIKTNRAYC